MTEPVTFKIEYTTDLKLRMELTRVSDGVSVAGELDAQDVEKFIEAFGAIRAGMSDAVPEKLDPMPRLPTTEHPHWHVYDPRPEGHLLAIRHPGFGWLGFLLAEDAATALAGWLLRPLAEPLKVDASPGAHIGATAVSVERYTVGGTSDGRIAIGMQASGGAPVFFAMAPETAREMAEMILRGKPVGSGDGGSG